MFNHRQLEAFHAGVTMGSTTKVIETRVRCPKTLKAPLSCRSEGSFQEEWTTAARF